MGESSSLWTSLLVGEFTITHSIPQFAPLVYHFVCRACCPLGFVLVLVLSLFSWMILAQFLWAHPALHVSHYHIVLVVTCCCHSFALAWHYPCLVCLRYSQFSDFSVFAPQRYCPFSLSLLLLPFVLVQLFSCYNFRFCIVPFCNLLFTLSGW